MNKIEKLAYQFRITHGISDFPITFERLLEIMKERGYKVRYFSESEEELRENELWQYTEISDAFSGVVNGVISTYINDSVSYQDRISVTGHELAHIVLGDILDRVGDRTTEQEDNASEFTSYFLAPPCYLNSLNIKTLEDIEYLLPSYSHRLCKEIWANLTSWQQRHEPLTYKEECVCKIMGVSSKLDESDERNNASNYDCSASSTPTVDRQVEIRYIPQLQPAPVLYQNKKRQIARVALNAIIVILFCAVCLFIGYHMSNDNRSDNQTLLSDSGYQSQTQSESPPDYTELYQDSQSKSIPTSSIISAPPSQHIAEPSESHISSTAEQSEMIVYVTKSGEKYHKPTCQYVKYKTNTRGMPLSDAEAQGYKPCSVCF